MALAGRAPVAPPLTSPYRVGLLSSARVVTDNERWAGGIGFRPENLAPPTDDTGGTFDPCDVPTFVPGSGGGEQDTDPFGIWESVTCSTMGGDIGEDRARAAHQLELRRSWWLEKTLWTGEVNGAAFANFTGLAAGGAAVEPLGATAVGLPTGLRKMVQFLGEAAPGVRCMIHVPEHIGGLLAFYGLAYRDGNLWRTSLCDHLIVGGQGYDGSDPDGSAPAEGEVWIYGTGPVEIRLSGVETVPPDDPSAVDTTANDIEVYATQLALITWDTTIHIGIPVCLEDPGPDCAAGS